MAKLNRATGLPSHEELYPKGVGGWVWDHSVGWVLDHKIASGIITAAATGAIAAGILLSTGGSGKEAINTQPSPPAQTSSGQTGQTASEIYYSQVRASLLQDVPELANYRSALDYTAQRMVDMKNVYGLSIDQVRAPITKWVQANIEWDKKGERLVPFSESVDLIPDAMLKENFTLSAEANDKVASASSKGYSVPLAAMQIYVDELIAEHDNVWSDIKDPAKLEMFLESTFGYMQWNVEIAEKYKNAIRTYGTFEDKAGWALLGRVNYLGSSGVLKPLPNWGEESVRNEYFLSSLLAAGGDGRILNNILYFERDGKGITRGDRQTMFRMSKQLKQAISSRPEEFGTLLDPNLLAPYLPSVEAVEAAKTYNWPTDIKNVSMPLVFVYEHWNGAWGSEKRFVYGTSEVARKLGY